MFEYRYGNNGIKTLQNKNDNKETKLGQPKRVVTSAVIRCHLLLHNCTSKCFNATTWGRFLSKVQEP